MKKKKILIIKLGAIGDVVHTTIVTSAIKSAHPNWEVHYLTQTVIAGVLENNPSIDKILVWDRKKKNSKKQLWDTIKILFNEHYDIIFNFTSSPRNILMSLLAFPKKIVSKKTLGGLWVEDYFFAAKKVIPDLEIPESLVLGVNPEIEENINEMMNKYPKPHFAISPGGRSDKSRQGRIWNIQKWKELVDQLQLDFGGTIFVCGSPDEREIHNQLQRNGVVIITGETSLKETNALLKNVDLMISGDTGPLHIASAFDTKTLAIIGSTSPIQIRPYGKNGNFITAESGCKHCWNKKCKYLKEGEIYTPCMEAISSESVMKKIKEILNPLHN